MFQSEFRPYQSIETELVKEVNVLLVITDQDRICPSVHSLISIKTMYGPALLLNSMRL